MRPTVSLVAAALAAAVAAVVLLGAAAPASARPRHRKAHAAPPAPSPVADALQLVVVIAPSWDASSGTLQRYQRSRPGAPFHAVGARVPVMLGKAGLAWGKGLHGAAPAPPVKAEGDNKSPAGAFRLSSVFGYDPAPPKGAQLPYVTLTPQIECVDDPASSHYNVLVDKSKVTLPDWNSSEHMLRPDGLYKFGVIVDHNADKPVANAGSCIFLHIARPGSPTAGCTSMDEAALAQIVTWLDSSKQPALVQLPQDEWKRLRKPWKLP